MRYASKVIWVREMGGDWRIACSCGRVGWVIADKFEPPDAVRFYLERYRRDNPGDLSFNHLCYDEEMREKYVGLGSVRP